MLDKIIDITLDLIYLAIQILTLITFIGFILIMIVAIAGMF